MNETENMFTRIITRVWSDKAEKVPFSEVRKTINYNLAATPIATRVFESRKKNIKQSVNYLYRFWYSCLT